MLLIDENPESRLLAALATYRATDTDAHYIFFAIASRPDADTLRDIIWHTASRLMNNDVTQLYFLGSGDVCLLSAQATSQQCLSVIDKISQITGLAASFEWVIHQRLQSDHFRLPERIQEMEIELQKQRKEEEKQRQQMALQRRRSAILKGDLKSPAANINQRRARREKSCVMVIEDDAFTRQLVKNAIQKQHDVTALGEATHALDTYASLAPDVLLLDINLPDVTGHELLERIMQIDPSAYVVMLSGNVDSHNVHQAISKGAKGFIGKPFTKDKLMQYIKNCPTIRSAPQSA